MPPTWQCRVCGTKGNRKGACKKCKASVSETADRAIKDAVIDAAWVLSKPTRGAEET